MTDTSSAPSEPVTILQAPVRLRYTVHAGRSLSRFLSHLQQGRITGQRCPRCAVVYVPPRGACPTCGVAITAEDEVEVRDTGTVTTFAIVNVPYEGQPAELKLPYVCAYVLLDGAGVPLLHLLGGIAPEAVRLGLRVRAVWAPQQDRPPSLESIRYFAPGEDRGGRGGP